MPRKLLRFGRYHLAMADEADEKSQSPSDAKPQVSRTPIKVSSGAPVAPIALLVALVAVGLAIWALLKAPSEDPAGAQRAGDKTQVCNAFNTVTKAVSLQTHTDLGQDPVALQAVAGNARLALFGGGQYLLGQLGADTPHELADAVRSFATNLEDIGMNALAGVPNGDPVQEGRLRAGEDSRTKIVDLCK